MIQPIISCDVCSENNGLNYFPLLKVLVWKHHCVMWSCVVIVVSQNISCVYLPLSEISDGTLMISWVITHISWWVLLEYYIINVWCDCTVPPQVVILLWWGETLLCWFVMVCRCWRLKVLSHEEESASFRINETVWNHLSVLLDYVSRMFVHEAFRCLNVLLFFIRRFFVLLLSICAALLSAEECSRAQGTFTFSPVTSELFTSAEKHQWDVI